MADVTTGNEVVEEEKDGRSRIVNVITTIAVFSLIVYSIFNIISQQAEMVALRKESNELDTKITQARQQNDEYIRLLSSDDEAAYMERIAIESLGYAYPNERRFYVVEVK